MKYNELNIAPKVKSKRVGRGISAGQGKTAGRGTKGYGSRTGSKAKPGFSGGQNPLMQQLPKLPGFKSHRDKAEVVNIDQISSLKEKTITAQILADNKLVSSPFVRIKLLSDGEIKVAKTVELPEASKVAVSKLQTAGGSYKKVAKMQRVSTKTEK